jgi:hypothetical protein
MEQPVLSCQDSQDNQKGDLTSHKIGRFGSFPPNSRIYLIRPMLFALDRDRWAFDGQLLLAIRLWKDPRFVSLEYGGLDESAPEIGLPQLCKVGWMPPAMRCLKRVHRLSLLLPSN